MAYSYETGRLPTFSHVDCCVILVILTLTSAAGLRSAVRTNGCATPDGRRSFTQTLSAIVSTTVTFLSPLIYLGHSAEVYNYNSMFLYIVIGMLVAMMSTMWVLVPFFYRLEVTTTLQYLEMRFNSLVRLAGTVTLIGQTMVTVEFLLYAPSFALATATGLDLVGCVVALGTLGMTFSLLGGVATSVWINVCIVLVLSGTLMAIFVQGSMQIGGFPVAWRIADGRSRIEMDQFDVSPFVRHSFWSIVVGGGLLWTTLLGVSPAQVQRCLSAPTVQRAQLILAVNIPCLVLIVTVSLLNGLLMYVFYADCHPVTAGLVKRSEQIMVLYIMDILGYIKGFPGLFLACLLASCLSALTMSLTTISALLYKEYNKYCHCRHMVSERLFKNITIIVTSIGAIPMAFVVADLGGLLQVFYTLSGLFCGPLLGLFVAGIFFPWTNSKGALCGCLVSFILTCWIGLGGLINKVTTAVKSPVYSLACYYSTSENRTWDNTTVAGATVGEVESYDGVVSTSTLSYLYLTPVGAGTAVLVGLVVSLITGYVRPSSLDPKLICPIFDVVLPCLPECVLRPLRFGINHQHSSQLQTHRITVDQETSPYINYSFEPDLNCPEPSRHIHPLAEHNDHVWWTRAENHISNTDNESHVTSGRIVCRL